MPQGSRSDHSILLLSPELNKENLRDTLDWACIGTRKRFLEKFETWRSINASCSWESSEQCQRASQYACWNSTNSYKNTPLTAVRLLESLDRPSRGKSYVNRVLESPESAGEWHIFPSKFQNFNNLRAAPEQPSVWCPTSIEKNCKPLCYRMTHLWITAYPLFESFSCLHHDVQEVYSAWMRDTTKKGYISWTRNSTVRAIKAHLAIFGRSIVNWELTSLFSVLILQVKQRFIEM
jgi:hypothetical protein